MSRYGAAFSEHPDSASAVGEVIGEILDAVGPAPDLVSVFVTSSHRDSSEQILTAIGQALNPSVVIGATAVSVISGSIEIEERPAISLWAASECSVQPIRLQARQRPDGWCIDGLEDEITGTLLLLADPFSFSCDVLLAQNSHLRIVGGLASAAGHPGGNRLMLNNSVYTDGAVGVLIESSTQINTVVSQGCRPIGRPFIVTKSQGNMIFEMGGRSAVQRLRETLLELDEADRTLVGKGLHMGIVVNEHKSEFGRGDFLIRSLLGADEKAEVLAVGDSIEVGTTVQFQVRDAATADEDLRTLMAQARGSSALLFTCNGRGTHLFVEPNHDAGVVTETLNNASIAGMFCAGEIGPIAGQNFLHGFTASVVLFP
ncbi:MAG: hypothetical protein F4138_04580 [Acidimicrobiia bacterium]|nr:hypothetical protein [Acidimicrobiia bacterium]MYC58496.1 hypothetical protein [Acidimicrobiia bacterium]MYG94254.1 hypothetical protein [Acidimicrobiia bacterium]MYI30398.1 hypothetical protein [Acidimicrobiia bacterium]